MITMPVRFIFKEPVYSRDQNFNPIIIVAEYETISTGNSNDYTYGGRAGVKLFDNKLKAGVTYIHEGQGDQSGNLYGTDASLKLDQTQNSAPNMPTAIFSSFRRQRNRYSAAAECFSGGSDPHYQTI